MPQTTFPTETKKLGKRLRKSQPKLGPIEAIRHGLRDENVKIVRALDKEYAEKDKTRHKSENEAYATAKKEKELKQQAGKETAKKREAEKAAAAEKQIQAGREKWRDDNAAQSPVKRCSPPQQNTNASEQRNAERGRPTIHIPD